MPEDVFEKGTSGHGPKSPTMRWMLVAFLVLCLLPNRAWASPDASGSPARATRTAFKGYELYTWRSGAGWRFAVLSGTNRTKSLAEVAAAPALTLAQLKTRLSAMAVGETVSWSNDHVGQAKGGLRLERPDPALTTDLKTLAEQLQIHLYLP